MNEFTLVRRNLFSRKLRSILLIVSTVTAFFLFGALFGALATLSGGGGSDKANRLLVTNKINLFQNLPIAYFDRIRGVEGVTAVSHATWFGGYYKEPADLLPVLMVESESYMQLDSGVVVDPAQLADFHRTLNGLLVDQPTADRLGWTPGKRVTLTSMNYIHSRGTGDWDFVVSGIARPAPGADPATGVIGHYEYLERGLPQPRGMVSWYVLTTADASGNEATGRAIDALFMNSGHETKTQTEAAFAEAFLAQVGNIHLIVKLVVGASFVTILLIVGNTMSAAIRERSKDIGVLKTLGFSRLRIFRIVVAESVLIASIGGAIGLGLAAVAMRAIAVGLGSAPMSAGLPANVLVAGGAAALLLGIMTGLLPALRATRITPLEALRN